VQSIPPVHSNRSVISSRTNVGFIPATGLAPRGLAGCSAVIPWQATAPLFQSPRGEPFGPSATRATYYALCRLLPFVQLGSRLAQLAWVNSLAPTARQISRGKTQNVPRVDAEFIKHTPTGKMEDFAVTCQLVPGVPHLRFGSCTSPRAFGSGFLQTPPHGDSPCPSPSLRLLLYLASGLSPDKFCAMPGTHVRVEQARHERCRPNARCFSARPLSNDGMDSSRSLFGIMVPAEAWVVSAQLRGGVRDECYYRCR